MIEIFNLHKSFNGKSILNGINLLIDEGETLAIIGGSGCGKSVLLKHIVGLLTPEKGYVKIDDVVVDVNDKKQLYNLRKKFGYLFQGAALFDSLSVGENVSLPLIENNYGYSKNEIQNIVDEKLELIGLPGIQNLKPSELSGGMKKRVGLARALVTQPSFMLYDEPTTGLDPIMSDSIDSLVMDLSKKLNVTSIVVTHDMLSVKNVADKIALIYNGQIEFHGTSSDLISSDNSAVKEFINRTGY